MSLAVRDLELEYSRQEGLPIRALGGVSLDVSDDEIVGIVGESGCGKSTLAYALIRILPANAQITRGRVLFHNSDLVRLSEERMQRIRWKRIAMVFQSSMNAFSPVHRIVDQLAAVHMAHFDSDRRKALRSSEGALVRMGIPQGRVRSYPHEFSGGMRQRAAIALALLLDPEVLIADEPTTALDVVVQDRILKSIEDWQRENGRSVIFVSHDISVVSEICDRIAVMYAGLVVELAETSEVLNAPLHPYTDALLDCIPDVRGGKGRLASLAGSPPDLGLRHQGCLFRSRCPRAFAECAIIAPGLLEPQKGHAARCLLYAGEPS